MGLDWAPTKFNSSVSISFICPIQLNSSAQINPKQRRNTKACQYVVTFPSTSLPLQQISAVLMKNVINKEDSSEYIKLSVLSVR